jgi:hypothetical protein
MFPQGEGEFGGRIEPGLAPATRAGFDACADILPKRAAITGTCSQQVF